MKVNYKIFKVNTFFIYAPVRQSSANQLYYSTNTIKQQRLLNIRVCASTVEMQGTLTLIEINFMRYLQILCIDL